MKSESGVWLPESGIWDVKISNTTLQNPYTTLWFHTPCSKNVIWKCSKVWYGMQSCVIVYSAKRPWVEYDSKSPTMRGRGIWESHDAVKWDFFVILKKWPLSNSMLYGIYPDQTIWCWEWYWFKYHSCEDNLKGEN